MRHWGDENLKSKSCCNFLGRKSGRTHRQERNNWCRKQLQRVMVLVRKVLDRWKPGWMSDSAGKKSYGQNCHSPRSRDEED